LFADDGALPRRETYVLHVAQRFSHPLFLNRFDDGRHAHRRDETDDGHHDHEFNERETKLRIPDAGRSHS